MLVPKVIHNARASHTSVSKKYPGSSWKTEQKRQKVGEEIPSEQSDSCQGSLLPSNDCF